ncbi:MAG: glycoside hydrolase family 127 protein [Spirochaetales bacterium]|nr:glycoside hydrolase family 127 protein [Spirochaetales bacterium]
MDLTERLAPVGLDDVVIEDPFWSPKIDRTIETLLSQYEKLEAYGTIGNFRIAAGIEEGSFRGPCFMDSDAYKWLEAVSYTFYRRRDSELEEKAGYLVGLIRGAQADDGYIDTYITINGRLRYTDLESVHELYCAGHLIEAAVAHFSATSKRDLLEVGIKAADNIYRHFIEGGRAGVPGHEEIELALVRLYRLTGDGRYFELARVFIDIRGTEEVSFTRCPDDTGKQKDRHACGQRYFQNHVPITALTEVTGHAVRALYYNCGVTDVYLETGDEKYGGPLGAMWENMVTKRMHITGGVGSLINGESFGADYELPNEHTYNETCAQIASIFWNHRMAQTGADSRYHDIVELTLYNGFLSGISLDGKKYFYPNPLKSSGRHERSEWFQCACCPPNMARLFASLGQYIYGTSRGTIFVNQFIGGRASIRLPGTGTVGLLQEGEYPRYGEVRFTVGISHPAAFTIALRKPAWLEKYTIEINGKRHLNFQVEKGYISIMREWKDKDTIAFVMAIRPVLMSCHRRVTGNAHHCAVAFGPFVYCLEQIDNPGADLFDIRIDPDDIRFGIDDEKSLSDGIPAISFNARIDTGDTPLYYALRKMNHTHKKIRARAVPYYAWNNRGKGKMLVWIPLIS